MARPIHDSEVNSPLPRLEQPQLYVSIIIVDNCEFLESIDDQNKKIFLGHPTTKSYYVRPRYGVVNISYHDDAQLVAHLEFEPGLYNNHQMKVSIFQKHDL